MNVSVSQDLSETQEAETSLGKADAPEKLLTDLSEEIEV